jgi:hypothetical protein
LILSLSSFFESALPDLIPDARPKGGIKPAKGAKKK